MKENDVSKDLLLDLFLFQLYMFVFPSQNKTEILHVTSLLPYKLQDGVKIEKTEFKKRFFRVWEFNNNFQRYKNPEKKITPSLCINLTGIKTSLKL